ncbi:MAG: MBL fold metallo-hydrolase [Vulcanimicrobiaceae bacterium]
MDAWLGTMTLELRFLGTRGYIEESSALHRMHSALMLICEDKRLLLDAGQTWKGRLHQLTPDWIAITHAHPDHAFALEEGTDVPVYVSAESLALLKHYPVKHFRIFEDGQTIRLGPFRVRPYRVIHSIRAPAVGFRVRAAQTTLTYNPDVISIPDEARVLSGVDVYIGDGASLTRPLVRRRGESLFGHTTVRAQLNWCKRHNIDRAYVVHCGKQLVEADPKELQQRVDELAGPTLRALVAYDGLAVRFQNAGAK